jgi:hypothetical protein
VRVASIPLDGPSASQLHAARPPSPDDQANGHDQSRDQQLPDSSDEDGSGSLAFDAFFLRYQRPLSIYLRRLLPTEESATDLTQEVFFGAWPRFVVALLNYLGIVAEVYREIGIADWLDELEPEHRQQVSVGTATVAVILNRLGFSNRCLYHLLGQPLGQVQPLPPPSMSSSCAPNSGCDWHKWTALRRWLVRSGRWA